MCLSEQYVKCALSACPVRVLVGYTDPNRPFQGNEETTLCGKLMDAASGLAVSVLLHFCSKAHCEEGKEDHEVLMMKEYNSVQAQKERELDSKQEEFMVDPDREIPPSEHATTDTAPPSTSVTDIPLSTSLPSSAHPSSSASPPSECQKNTSPLEEKMKKQEKGGEEEEEKSKKEVEERQAAFEVLVREKDADLKKKLDVIENVERKMNELETKLRDMGAYEANSNATRTDFSEEEKLVVAPIDATYIKYCKLKRKLTRDHDMIKCELEIEIAKFNTRVSEEEATVLVRKIDKTKENERGCDLEEQMRIYQGELMKVRHEIEESNSQRVLLEQRLKELVAEGDGDVLVPVANKPPYNVPPPPPATDACKISISPLFIAAKKGDLALVQKLLEQGVDKDKANDNEHGMCPLHIAAGNGHLPVVKCLLEHGADVNKGNIIGCNPLYAAAFMGHLAVVQLLVEQGVDTNKVSDYGGMAIHGAAQEGHLGVVRYLIEQGADKDKADNEGYSPLHYAALDGHLDVVQFLVEQGADKDKADNEGYSPLFIAAQNGYLDMVRYFVEQRADKDKAMNDGWIALLFAAQNGHLAVVRYLIEQGADKDKAMNSGWTALLLAAQGGHLGIVQHLIEQGADKDKADNDGGSPLFIAAQNGHFAVVQHLVEQGADKNKAMNNGRTALLAAAQEGHLGVVRYLVEQGADKDKANNDGATPLFVAAGNGHVTVVQYLVEEQLADVDKAFTATDHTPLHIAVQQGHVDVAVCLMEHGMANLNARTRDGQCPMDLATNEEMRQAITNEEIRRRDHGFRRAVLPNPTPAERASGYLACLDGDQDQVVGNAVTEGGGGHGQASANSVAEEDDDDSGSDEEHEVEYLKSLKRQRTK